MDIFDSYRWTRKQWTRWISASFTFKPYDVRYLQAVILKELRYRRAYPESCSPSLLIEVSEEYRMVTAILRAYPNLNEYHARLESVRA